MAKFNEYDRSKNLPHTSLRDDGMVFFREEMLNKDPSPNRHNANKEHYMIKLEEHGKGKYLTRSLLQGDDMVSFVNFLGKDQSCGARDDEGFDEMPLLGPRKFFYSFYFLFLVIKCRGVHELGLSLP